MSPEYVRTMAENFPDIITDDARARAPITSETVIGVSVLFIALSTLFTGTRLYTRFTVYQQFWWDDCKFEAQVASFPRAPR